MHCCHVFKTVAALYILMFTSILYLRYNNKKQSGWGYQDY